MKRLDNHSGTITKLSGNRTRPYIVQSQVLWDGSKYKRQILGYAKSYVEAMKILTTYKISEKTTTFKNLFKIYFENLNVCPNRYKLLTKIYEINLASLHNLDITDVIFDELQNIMDTIPTKSAATNAKIMLTNVYNIALKKDFVEKNVAELLDIKQSYNSYQTKRVLTTEEIKNICEKSDLTNKILKIMLYTGCRINEVCSLTGKPILYDEGVPYIITGSKTTSGKNRIVPLHPNIVDDVKDITEYPNQIRTGNIAVLIQKKYTFSSHCCRVTFISKLQELEVTPSKIKRIVGHKTQDVTDGVYTKYPVGVLYAEILKISYLDDTF